MSSTVRGRAAEVQDQTEFSFPVSADSRHCSISTALRVATGILRCLFPSNLSMANATESNMYQRGAQYVSFSPSPHLPSTDYQREVIRGSVLRSGCSTKTWLDGAELGVPVEQSGWYRP
jgi:hypothetical protein